MTKFVEALVKETAFHAKNLPSIKIDTLYMGGGTPSMLSPKLLELLFHGIAEHLDLSSAREISLEANPATFTDKKVQLFKDLGISRISLGIQSFSDRILKTLGREHNRQQAIESVQLLQQVGMPEINIDLMFAVPGQDLSEWQDTIEQAASLKTHHISCYNLNYEEDTEFIKKLTQGEYTENEEINARYFEICHNTLTEAGFHHYETSNYAIPGFESKHNQSYWEGRDYLAVGPSAVGTFRGERYRNRADTNRYMEMIQTVGHAKTEIERIDDEAFRIERIALLLRTSKGLPKIWLEKSKQEEIELLLHEKLATWENNSLKLINHGPMLVDAIAERLI
jgi:oxygen-independent coproporphyrinogen III oxidase